MIRKIKEESAIILDARLDGNRKQLLQYQHDLSKQETELESVESKWIKNEIAADTYQRWHGSYVKKILELKENIKNLSRGQH